MMSWQIILRLEDLGEINYEDFLLTGDSDLEWSLPDDEWQS